MRPIQTDTTTRFLGAPPGWDPARDGKCETLPVVDSEGCIYSYWHVDFVDRLRILFGRPVRLAVAGSSHPPVMIDVEP